MEDMVDDIMETIMMIKRKNMSLGVEIRTRGEEVEAEIREEEVEDKDL